VSFEGVLFDPQTGSSRKVHARVVLGALEITPAAPAAAGPADTVRVDLTRVALGPGGWDRGSIQIVW
jgi:hypothetical protein